MREQSLRVLLVDLNNYARYPTLAIGYLVAALRREGIGVEVLSPMQYGVPAFQREPRETGWDQVRRRLYFSSHPVLPGLQDHLRALHARMTTRPHPRTIEAARNAMDGPGAGAMDGRGIDALLLSAYIDHRPTVEALAALAAERRVPVLLGGPVFNIPEVTRDWLGIRGLTAAVGAEVDLILPDIVKAMVAGEDLTRFPGVFLPDGRTGPAAPPLTALDKLPVPDFSDFPWEKYPIRVIPMMAGRGCSWGRCTFCSDVFTANGRTFRARPVDAVLDEMEQQSRRYDTKDVVFLDIKLNSSLEVWRGLLDGFQARLPGGRWIGTVHVAARGDNGLTADDLKAARRAGMVRTSFGLETGSQRLNTRMAKGTTVERMSAFVHDAHDAGISVRCTAMLGYPGETADDVDATARFLEEHRTRLDRVRLSRFKAVPGTRFQRMIDRYPNKFPGIRNLAWSFGEARARYRYEPAEDSRYRRAKARVLDLVHAINRKPIGDDGAVFDGLM